MAPTKASSRRSLHTARTLRRERRRPRSASARRTPKERRTTILIIRWGLVALSLSLLLTAESGSVNWVLGLAAVGTLAASNIALERSKTDAGQGAVLDVGIALLDGLLVVTAWYASGYESFAAVIVALALLNLALAGLNLNELGAIALAAVIFYLAIGQVD